MTKTPANCPYCHHTQHRPGVECESIVYHNGDRHWHRCLCLNLVNADRPCPPQMDCQGGTLGYSDVWYLQRGHSLSSANGVITPDVLKTAPVSPVGFAPALDDADSTETDIDRMMAAGTPVQIVTAPPATYGGTPAATRDAGGRGSSASLEQAAANSGQPVSDLNTADQAALRALIAEAVDRVFEAWREGLDGQRPQDAITDAVLGVLPTSDRAAQLETENARMRHDLEVMYGGAFDSLKPPPADRAGLSAKLWEIAEHHIVAEWICCEPLAPGHKLCAKGHAALGMVKTLLVDGDPEKAWNPNAPLLNVVLDLLRPAPADRAALRDLIADALAAAEGWQWAPGYDKALSPMYQHYLRQADVVMPVLPASSDQAAVIAERDSLGREADRLRKDWVQMRARAERAEAGRAAVLREAANALAAVGPEDSLVSGPKAWTEAVETLRRMADETPQAETHTCGNCEGIDPDTCLTNLDRPVPEARQETKPAHDEAPGQWCKCPSCWGWFVEDHPGEDLDELGRDLGWWSGLAEHRDAPAGVVAQPAKEADGDPIVCVCSHTRGEHLLVSGRLLCDACDPDSTDNLVCQGFDAL